MSRHDPLADPAPLIRQVYAYVAYRIGDGPDAQDVTSDTVERALRGRDTYDHAKGSPIAWLIGIARRCLSDHLQSRWAVVADPPEAAATADLEDRSLTRITLAEAIATLDEREQDLIALRYGADLTARQIAEALGLRTNAVEVALHRALARLRAELNREAGAVSVESSREAVTGQ